MYTTACIVEECKNVDKEIFTNCKPIFDQCTIYQCGHKKKETSASNCILDCIAQARIKFLVATQDIQLQGKLKYRTSPIPVFIFSHGQILPIKLQKKEIVSNNAHKSIFSSDRLLSSNASAKAESKSKSVKKSRHQYSVKNNSKGTGIYNILRRLEDE